MTPLCLQKPGLRELYRRRWPRDLILQEADKRKSRHQINRRRIKKPTPERVSRRSEDPVPNPWDTGEHKSLLGPPTPKDLDLSLFSTRSFPSGLLICWVGKKGTSRQWGKESFGPAPQVLFPLFSALPSRFLGPSVSAKHTTHTPAHHSVLSKQCLTHFSSPVLSPTTPSHSLPPPFHT